MRIAMRILTTILVAALPASAASLSLLVLSESDGPNVRIHGTNGELTNQMTNLPEERIVTTPPYTIPLPPGLSQPFGPFARGAGVFALEMYQSIGFAFDADYVAVASGPGTPARVRIWRNTSNVQGRAQRDGFFELVDADIFDFDSGGNRYTGGLNVALGHFGADESVLVLAVAPRTGEPRVALHQFDPAAAGALTPYAPDGVSNTFIAYPEVPANYNGGVNLTTVPFNHYYVTPARHTLITAPGKGFKPWIKVFTLDDADPFVTAVGPYVLQEWLAFSAKFKGGVNLLADTSRLIFSDTDDTNFSVMVFGQGPGGGAARVFVFDRDNAQLYPGAVVRPFGKTYTGGVVPTACDRDLTGTFGELAFTAQSANRGVKFYELAVSVGPDFDFQPANAPVAMPLYTFKPGAPFKPTSRYRGSP